jgi:pyruvate dehydrogenase E2 component (dihydrolipoamide acetyltransferase)
MSTSVTMPALGESVSEGTVTRWLKQEGEQVNADEPLLEVSTDKVDTEIPAPASGVLQKIIVGEDETVAVGAELAVIGDGASGGDGADQSGDAQGDGAQQADAQQADAQQSGDAQQAETQQADAQQEDPTAAAAPQDDGGAQAPAAPADGSQAEQPQQDAQPAQEQVAPAGEPAATPSGGTSVTMPALGESVSEGTVTRWLKQEGEQVNADEPLL